MHFSSFWHKIIVFHSFLHVGEGNFEFFCSSVLLSKTKTLRLSQSIQCLVRPGMYGASKNYCSRYRGGHLMYCYLLVCPCQGGGDGVRRVLVWPRDRFAGMSSTEVINMM